MSRSAAAAKPPSAPGVYRKASDATQPLIAALASPYLLFAILSLAVMGPLLAPGLIFTLDSTIALNGDFSGYLWGTTDGFGGVFAATYNSAPIALVLSFFDLFLPEWLVQRAYLMLLFWLAGVGAFRMPFLSGAGRCYAGVFYAVNPFTYIRFVTGQWGVLGSYALLPFAIASFIELLEKPAPRPAIKTALFLTLIGFLQIHGLALALLALAIVYLARIAAVRDAFRSTVKYVALGLALFVGVNLFWIARLFVSRDGAASGLEVSELEFFAATPALDVLSMRGFWLGHQYLDFMEGYPILWLAFVPIMYLALYGAVELIKNSERRWLGIAFASTALLSLMLAVGPGLAATHPLFEFLWENIAPYSAFRDSHKFVSLLALAYAYLGASGLQALIRGLGEKRPDDRRLPKAAVALAVMAPILLALPIFGTWGQLKPRDYPSDWHAVRGILDADGGDYNVLALPWQMYTNFDFLDNRWKRLANPAPSFFSQPVIAGDNIEIDGVSSDSSNPVSAYVETLLDNADSLDNFGAFIVPLNAKYVVLFDAPDFRSYEFLARQGDLEQIYQGDGITLYRNLNPTAKAYALSEIASRTDSSLSLLSGYEPAFLTGFGAISAEFVNVERDYVSLNLPQHADREGWTLEGQAPTFNLGIMPTFRTEFGFGRIVFSRFYRLYLPAYVISGMSLMAALFVFRKARGVKPI